MGEPISYYTPYPPYDTYTPQSPLTEFHQQNVDDLIYRYSSEFDRPLGTPTVGIYAQDGLWDDDESTGTRESTSTVTAGTDKSSRTSKASVRTRSRSATVSSVAKEGSESPGMWSWNRKMDNVVPDVPVPPKETDRKSLKSLKKKESKSRLKGKGRRGELSIGVQGDESFEAPPPLPDTPSSFLTTSSPALSTSSPFSSPLPHSSRSPFEPGNSHLNEVKQTKSKSTWKRGVEKIFRSKSSVALREVFSNNQHTGNTPPPPTLPAHHNLPKPPHHLLKPFSSSAPPVPLRESRRVNQIDILSPTQSYTSSIHSNLHSDPFASSLDLQSNNPPRSYLESPLLPPSKLKAPRHSPSLKDLKNFITPGKPKLAKAKSIANLAGKENGPSSAPPFKTEFSPIPSFPRRMSAAVNLPTRNSGLRGEPLGKTRESTLNIATDYFASPERTPGSQKILNIPAESPPLQPPHPPYFPAPTSLSNRLSSPSSSSSRLSSTLSIKTGLPLPTSQSSGPDTPLSPPPVTPLPPLPSSPSVVHLDSPSVVSTPKLLPRSRSTSMSLKSPPTSSSFFDLYEQLGIWPGAEKVEGRGVKEENNVKEAVVESPQGLTAPPQPIKESPSATFSAASWEAAIESFPVFDDFTVPDNDMFKPSIDFGSPYAGDADTTEVLYPPVDHDEFDAFSHIAVAADSSHGTVQADLATSTSTTAGSSENAGRATGATANTTYNWTGTYYGVSGRGSTGSGGSSRNSSRQRKRRDANGWSDHDVSSDSEQDLDDVPLSQLHPQALQAQQARKEEAKKRKEEKRAARGRSIVREPPSSRNPGVAASGKHWDGEGGVPADILSHKLEKVLIRRSANSTAVMTSPVEGRGDYPWAAAVGTGGVSRMRSQTERVDHGHSMHKQRSKTEPFQMRPSGNDRYSIRPGSSGRGPTTTGLTPLMPSSGPSPNLGSAPYSNDNAARPQPRTLDTQESVQTVQPTEAHISRSSTSTRRPDFSRQNSTATSTSHTVRLPPPPTPVSPTMPADPSRQSDTYNRAQPNLALTKQRSRAMSVTTSSSRHGTPDDDNLIKASNTTTPLCNLTYVKAFIGGIEGTKVTLELGAETSSRQVLVAALERGDLQGLTTGKSWVLCEVFAEVGLERQVREYEQLQTIVKGWDGMAKFNSFVFRQSNRGVPTWTRAIPMQAPFFGAFVQCETKKGKWSKRWLETRGGQIFLSKNEKNKDELHISTSFFDIYSMTRAYKSPKPYVFVLKRIEAASSFEDPQDYMFTFSSDEATTWRLVAAIYDAKSFDLAHTQPQLLASPAISQAATIPSVPQPSKSTEGNGRMRRPTISAGSHAPAQPLVDLKDKRERSSAFTGKGLLKI